MLMFHSLRARTPMASMETFPPTPSNFLINAPNPHSKPAMTPCPPNRSYARRQTYSTSLYAATPDGWTTLATVLAFALYPFEGRTPTVLLRPHNKIPNPSTDRPQCKTFQAHADPLLRPLLTILRKYSPYPSIPSCSRCYILSTTLTSSPYSPGTTVVRWLW